MFYFGVGCGRGGRPSKHRGVADSARRATEKAIDDLQDFKPSIVFVYMTSDYAPYKEPLQAISDVLHEHGADFSKAPLVGGTASAFVDNGTYSSGLAVWILGSEHIYAAVASVEDVFGTGREERIHAALRTLNLPQAHAMRKGFLFTVMPGYKSLEDEKDDQQKTWLEDAAILESIIKRIGYRVPIFGGSVTDSFSSRDGKDAREFLNGKVLRNSVVLAWVETGLKFGIGMPPAYEVQKKESQPALITRFQGGGNKGSVVERIREIRADKYLDKLNTRFGGRSHYLVSAHGADGSFSIANPIRAQAGRGTVVFHPQLDLWTTLIPFRVTREDFTNSASNAIEQAIRYIKPGNSKLSPAVVLLMSCRGKITRIKTMSNDRNLEDIIDAEAKLARKKWPEAQIIGSYGGGEQGLTPLTGMPTSQTWSASALVILDELNERAEMTKVLAANQFLERISKQAASISDLHRSIVTAVNRLVMGKGCSLFLRSDYVPWDPHNDQNRFVLVATSGLFYDKNITYFPNASEIIAKDYYYTSGQGLTGWVAKYGVTLRIDSREKTYLEQKRLELIRDGLIKAINSETKVSSLCWEDRVRENRPKDITRSPYLAVPINLGNETIGVVRISEIDQEARDRGKAGFSSFDERVLEICSNYILTTITLSFRHSEIIEFIVRRLSHALKSTMGLVETNLTALANNIGPGYERYFTRMKEAVNFLKRAGELSGTHIKSARIAVEERVEIGSLLDRLISLLRDKRVKWNKPKRKYYVRGNESGLENVFLEIINNSREFSCTKRGRIDVRVRERKGSCVVNISDNGPGVHQSIRDRLFESFAAYPDERLGMAMALAKRVVEEHGGEITELNTGHGANFCVTLPLVDKVAQSSLEGKENE